MSKPDLSEAEFELIKKYRKGFVASKSYFWVKLIVLPVYILGPIYLIYTISDLSLSNSPYHIPIGIALGIIIGIYCGQLIHHAGTSIAELLLFRKGLMPQQLIVKLYDQLKCKHDPL